MKLISTSALLVKANKMAAENDEQKQQDDLKVK
jgi:hypothetical protein